MPRISVVPSSPAVPREAVSSFVCGWETGALGAAWVHAAGALDLAATPQLAQSLAEAQLNARLVMLDLRDVTFIDCFAVDVVLEAAGRARHGGGRLMLARGPARVDRVFTLTGACDQLLIFDLAPAEPGPTVLAVARRRGDARVSPPRMRSLWALARVIGSAMAETTQALMRPFKLGRSDPMHPGRRPGRRGGGLPLPANAPNNRRDRTFPQRCGHATYLSIDHSRRRSFSWHESSCCQTPSISTGASPAPCSWTSASIP